MLNKEKHHFNSGSCAESETIIKTEIFDLSTGKECPIMLCQVRK